MVRLSYPSNSVAISIASAMSLAFEARCFSRNLVGNPPTYLFQFLSPPQGTFLTPQSASSENTLIYQVIEISKHQSNSLTWVFHHCQWHLLEGGQYVVVAVGAGVVVARVDLVALFGAIFFNHKENAIKR
ncbi:hypothetical protein Tco_1490501 [Tanacetum coccineum]